MDLQSCQLLYEIAAGYLVLGALKERMVHADLLAAWAPSWSMHGSPAVGSDPVHYPFDVWVNFAEVDAFVGWWRWV